MAFALLLTACGPLPRPFKPEVKPHDSRLLLRNGGEITVLPPRGAHKAQSEAFAVRLALALQAQGLAARAPDAEPTHPIASAAPANAPGNAPGNARENARESNNESAQESTTVSAGESAWGQAGPQGFHLRGQAVVLPLDGAREEVLMLWELVDGTTGRVHARDSQRGEVPKGAWQAAEPKALDPLAASLARRLAGQIQAPALLTGEHRILAEGHLTVEPIDGISASSSNALSKALAAELDRLTLGLQPQLQQGPPLLVQGLVDVDPPRGGWQKIALTWRVVEALSGAELGRIDQSNRIPAGSLEQVWRDFAQPIAQGAAVGIADLLRKTGRG